MTDAEMAEMQKTEAADMAAEAAKMHIESAAAMKPGHEEHAHAIAEAGEPKSFSLRDFTGRLHPGVVHFPIALFLMGLVAELMLIARPALGLATTVRFLTYSGAGFAVVAVSFGWLAAGFRLTDRSETLGLHRWTGTGIAVASLAAAWAASRTHEKRGLLRILLIAIAIALPFQGFWGAEMSLGPNHLGL